MSKVKYAAIIEGEGEIQTPFFDNMHDDEEHPAYCAVHKETVGWCTCHRNRRNALRAELRQSIAKIFGKESSDE